MFPVTEFPRTRESFISLQFITLTSSLMQSPVGNTLPFVHVSTELIEDEPISDGAMFYEFLHVSDPRFRSEVLANSVNSLESINDFMIFPPLKASRAVPHVKHVKSKCRPHHLN